MKKAYVKPVFMAEEFVLSDSVASGCGINVNTTAPRQIYDDVSLCDGGQSCKGHDFDQKKFDSNYWDYATSDTTQTVIGDVTYNNSNAYLFSANTQVCDFVWPGTNDANQVLVWNSSEVSKRDSLYVVSGKNTSYSQFFFGNSSDGSNNHRPGYEGLAFMS